MNKKDQFTIGELNKRLTIQVQTKTPDGLGGSVATWVDQGIVWAGIMPLRGQEKLMAEQVQNRVTHRVKIHYRSVFSGSWRFKFGKRYFNVESVINSDERGVFLELMCEETV